MIKEKRDLPAFFTDSFLYLSVYPACRLNLRYHFFSYCFDKPVPRLLANTLCILFFLSWIVCHIK